MRETYSNISGVILAGGGSIRMGIPKANLLLNGKRIIDIILDAFEPLFDEIFIVTDDKNRFKGFKDVAVIEDLVKGCGPLGGIYTGLKAISNDTAFFCACDMPFLRRDLIEKLLDISLENEYTCVVPYTSAGIEPLHAVYSKKNLGIIENLLKENNLSIKQLFKRCKCKYVEVGNEEAPSFYNVNTPEELKKIKL